VIFLIVDSAAHDGIVDISNAARVSKTEIELVNTVINGISEIIKLEQMLEKGENITCK
jgi:creatine kinase